MLEHYFAERAWSIILYAVISCCFFWILKNPKCKTTPVLWGYALILAILGFFFKPAESVDLYRLWMVADYYKGLPFLDMAQRVFMDWSGAPLSHIYLASLYTINMHLIPALTAWLFYVNIFSEDQKEIIRPVFRLFPLCSRDNGDCRPDTPAFGGDSHGKRSRNAVPVVFRQ